jgi:hypothetical protein
MCKVCLLRTRVSGFTSERQGVQALKDATNRRGSLEKVLLLGQRLLEYHKTVFLNRRAAARYQALASVISCPRLIEKRIYRAAVWQRLRTTAIKR